MPITVLARLSAKPGQGDALRAVLAEHLSDTRAFPGCSGLQVVSDLDDPDCVTLLEEWDTRETHQAYRAWRAEQDVLRTAMGPLLGAAPDVTYHAQHREVHWS
jgi:heme oxygenase (mycobilin-producing)